MTDDTTPDDESEHRRTLDIRTDADEEADDEFDHLLDAYNELRERDDLADDEPADEKLRELAAQKQQMSDNDTSDDADDYATPDTEFDPDDDAEANPETGETTVTLSDAPDSDADAAGDAEHDDEDDGDGALRFGEQVDRDDADFVDETPEGVQVADDETKAKRRAELAAEGHLPDDVDADDGEEDDDDEPTGGSQTAQQSNEQRYGVDVSGDPKYQSDSDSDVEPPEVDGGPDPEPPSVTEEEAAEMEFDADLDDADFEDVLADGLFSDVSDEIDPEEFDFEAQDVEDASERKEDKIIEINGVYFYLSQPEGDAFYNMIDAAQSAPDTEARHYLLIDAVVERPYDASKRVREWAGATRAQLATECAIHSGLHEMQDFQ